MRSKSLRFISILSIICLLVGTLAGCSKQKWVCDGCGISFSGTAYYGYSLDTTYCKECAWEYWNPLPIENYKKTASDNKNKEVNTQKQTTPEQSKENSTLTGTYYAIDYDHFDGESIDSDYYIQFNTDNTFIFYYYGDTGNGTYQISDNIITIQIDNDTNYGELSSDRNQITSDEIFFLANTPLPRIIDEIYYYKGFLGENKNLNYEEYVAFNADGTWSQVKNDKVLWEGTYSFTSENTIKCQSPKIDDVYFTISDDKEYIRANGASLDVYARDLYY